MDAFVNLRVTLDCDLVALFHFDMVVAGRSIDDSNHLIVMLVQDRLSHQLSSLHHRWHGLLNGNTGADMPRKISKLCGKPCEFHLGSTLH